jgi:hypothetical protein
MYTITIKHKFLRHFKSGDIILPIEINGYNILRRPVLGDQDILTLYEVDKGTCPDAIAHLDYNGVSIELGTIPIDEFLERNGLK